MSIAKHWLLAPSAEQHVFQRYRGMSPILAQVLYNRGLVEPEQAYEFLNADDLSSWQPAGNQGQKAGDRSGAGRIRTAIKQKELVVVYGDFDADGVTSTVLLVQALKALGANVHPYIPHRVDEGYGLNSEALLKLARRGVKLVITVDCGIRSVQEVEDGKAYGLDMIITDHHSVGAEMPDAVAVINPKLTTALTAKICWRGWAWPTGWRKRC